jgi:hypothetical protein
LSFLAGISATWQHCWGSIHCWPGRYGKSQLQLGQLQLDSWTCVPCCRASSQRLGVQCNPPPHTDLHLEHSCTGPPYLLAVPARPALNRWSGLLSFSHTLTQST